MSRCTARATLSPKANRERADSIPAYSSKPDGLLKFVGLHASIRNAGTSTEDTVVVQVQHRVLKCEKVLRCAIYRAEAVRFSVAPAVSLAVRLLYGKIRAASTNSTVSVHPGNLMSRNAT